MNPCECLSIHLEEKQPNIKCELLWYGRVKLVLIPTQIWNKSQSQHTLSTHLTQMRVNDRGRTI